MVAALAVLGAPLGLTEACGSSSPPVRITPAEDAGPTLLVDSGVGHPTIDAMDETADAAPDAASSDGGADTAAPRDSGADGVSAVDSGPPPPVCSPDASVASTSTLVLGTRDPDLMGGISNDGLVIAWTSVPADDAGAPAVHWAERSQTSATFGAAQTLDTKYGAVAPDHVALRGDGLRLVFVSADRMHLYEIGRTAYGMPFETDDTSEDFQGVNPSTEGTSTNSGFSPFGSPSLGSSFKTTWAFLRGNAGFVVAESSLGIWSNPAWAASLSPPANDRYTIVPTGWSVDGLTLFYWDSAAGVERGAWRDRASITFVSATTIGPSEQYATPSADCTQLYFSAPGAAGDLDLFVSPFH